MDVWVNAVIGWVTAHPLVGVVVIIALVGVMTYTLMLDAGSGSYGYRNGK